MDNDSPELDLVFKKNESQEEVVSAAFAGIDSNTAAPAHHQ